MTVSQRIPSSQALTSMSSRSLCPIDASACTEQQLSGAGFTAHRMDSDLLHIAVRGEIDIRNASALCDFSRRHLESARVVLDLSHVEFFGAAGLRVFDELDICAREHGHPWTLVCGRPVQRLLRILERPVPVSVHASVNDALAALGLECAS